VNLDRPRVIQPRSAPDPNPLIPLPLLSFSLALHSPAAPSRLHPDADRIPLPVHHPSVMVGRTAPAPSPPSPSRPTPSPPLHPGSRHGRYHDQRFGRAGAARCAMGRNSSPLDADHLHPQPVREVSDFHFFDWMACGRVAVRPPHGRRSRRARVWHIHTFSCPPAALGGRTRRRVLGWSCPHSLGRTGARTPSCALRQPPPTGAEVGAVVGAEVVAAAGEATHCKGGCLRRECQSHLPLSPRLFGFNGLVVTLLRRTGARTSLQWRTP
jgi:hypothetical protein